MFDKIRLIAGLLLLFSFIDSAANNDPFKRVIMVNDNGAISTIAPKVRLPRSPAVLLFESKRDRSSGKCLRQIAEQGFVAVLLAPQDEINLDFKRQIESSIDSIEKNFGEHSETIWICSDPRTFARLQEMKGNVRNPPDLIIGINSESGNAGDAGVRRDGDQWPRHFGSKVPLHFFDARAARPDEQFARPDPAGYIGKSWIVKAPLWNTERVGIMRSIAELIAEKFHLSGPVSVNTAHTTWRFGFLCLFLAGICLIGKRVKMLLELLARGMSRFSMTAFSLATISICCGVVAADITLHSFARSRSPKGLWLAFEKSHVSPPNLVDNIEKMSLVYRGRGTIAHLVEQVELAEIQRSVVKFHVTEELYISHVVSPKLKSDDDFSAQSWRSALWEAFSHKSRYSRDVYLAALGVGSLLRERVNICRTTPGGDVLTWWKTGACDLAGYKMLYVAALRSSGIPARLTYDTGVEVYGHTGWIVLPGPIGIFASTPGA